MVYALRKQQPENNYIDIPFPRAYKLWHVDLLIITIDAEIQHTSVQCTHCLYNPHIAPVPMFFSAICPRKELSIEISSCITDSPFYYAIFTQPLVKHSPENVQ